MTTCRPGARIYVAPLLFLLLTQPVQLYSQDQPPDGSSTIRVHALPTVNRTGEAQFEAVATTVTDTVALTLRLLGRYRISEGAPEGFADWLPHRVTLSPAICRRPPAAIDL